MSFIITTSSNEGGYITPSGDIEVIKGGTQTFEFSFDVGYGASKILIDGVEQEITNSYTFEDVNENHSIELISTPVYFTITSSSSEGGTIYPPENINVQQGHSQTFNFFPDENYEVSRVLVDGIEIDNKSAYTFNNVSDNHIIHVEYSYIPKIFELIIMCGDGGKLNPEKTIKVIEGSDQTFDVIPNNKYELESLSIDEEIVEVVNNKYTLENIMSNHSIFAKFKYVPSYYTIKASCNDGGKITNMGEHSYIEYSSIEYSFTPNKKYKVKNVIIDDVSYGSIDKYTFSDLESNHSIDVEFEYVPDVFTIITSCDENGIISQNGEIKVTEATDFTLDIQPNTGYKIKEILVDSEISNCYTGVTIFNVWENHTIHVSFEPKSIYTITSSSDDNCKIYPLGEVSVFEEDNQKFEISANSGYFIKSVKVDNSEVDFDLLKTSYIFEDVLENHTISVETEKIEYEYHICSISSNHGSIEPSGVNSFEFMDEVTYRFTPISGYKLNNIIVDGKVIKTSSDTYTFYNVRSDHTITANFVADTKNNTIDEVDALGISLNYDAYGRVEPSKIYLSKPNKHLLGVLNGIDEQSCNLTMRGNNTHTISFDVYKEINGEETNYYNDIDVLMELYVSSIGWFKIIQYPEISFDGNVEKTTITAESYEIELQQFDKIGFVVNKASEDSLEMMATDNTYLDENGYKLFRDNVRFYRNTSDLELLLNDFNDLDESEQNLDNLKSLLINNPSFLISSWRCGIDINSFVESIPSIKASLMKDNLETDYLDELQELYGVKDSHTGETALTNSIIKKSILSHPELIEFLPLDINTENINVKNKVFNSSAVNSNGDFSATLNVTGAYCVQGSEINFKIDTNGNKGSLTYRYKFGNDSNSITDYISQNSIDWTSYYDITSNDGYMSIPIYVDVVDTYIDDNGIEQTQKITLNTYVYIFKDKDTLSNYLINNNMSLTYEEYETYSLVELIELEIQRMKDLSLLDQILLECPSWKVGTVDWYVDDEFPEPLYDDVGAFEIDSQDVYSLLTQTMAQYFSCIFVFDTMNMTVNAYRVSGLGQDTNIHLGYRNVQNSISITPNDELYTVFNVSNSDGLNLAYVNFGDREIEDISYFLNEDYLDLELINKYNAWRDYRESFRDKYIDLSRLYNSQNETVTELYNRVPIDGLETKQYEDFSYSELDEELNNYIALIEGIKSNFRLYVNGSEYQKIIIEASKNPYISYEYDGLVENLDEIQKSIYWNDYRQYKEIINTILITMYNFDKNEDDDNYYEHLDDWQWDMITYGYMYGLDELKSRLDVFKNGIESYKEYSLPYSSSNKNMIETTYNKKREEYLKYKDSYNKCMITLRERELEVSIAESILNEYYEKRNEITQKVKKSNWKSDEYPLGFTDEDYEKLGRLYKSTDYINENIIYTSISSTDDIVDKAYELYEDAVDNLYANSHPRLTYSTNQDNILDMIDYNDYMNDFRLFNFIRISIRDDYQVKLRVIEYSLNPMIHDNNLNLVFSNMIQYKSKRNDFAALLDNAISTAKNQISSLTKSSSKSNEFSFDYDLVKSLLNSKAFGSYMGNYTANSVTSEAIESALSNIGSLSSNSAFIKYLNSNLLVTNDAYMDYLNSNLVVSNVADIRNLMFGSATGTTLQSKFSSSVISLLEDATIKSAMIESLNASKINAGTINTNYVEISSDSGNMKITDNTIQIKDDNDVTRVQIGKDATNDYNMYVLDENGKVMFDATGLHEDGIKNGIIRDDMVSDNANISGSKLNIQSLYSSMNDSGYSLNASNIKLDAENQNLEVSFNTLNSKVIQQGNSLSSYGTKLSVLQGQIDSKIWKTDIETLVAESETLYNLNTQFSEFEQTLDGFETTVSQTNSRIDGLNGMRNLILDSGDVKTSTSGEDEFVFETSLPIKPNSEYTFVLHGFANNNDLANGGFALYFGNNLVEDKILCRTESETVIFTATSPSVIVDEYHIIFKNVPTETVLESKIEWICMYEGNASSVSDLWIPAPEDTAVMTTEAYSVATQTATDFSWLVTKDENTSEMTLTDEALEIISKSVEINGTVSFGTFDSATRDMLSSQIEANSNMILKLYDGNTTPVYTPSNLILNAYKGYADDRIEYSGIFKIEQYINDTWIVIETTTTTSTTLELKLSNKLDPNATKIRCSLYSDEETPILIDSITLDIVDDFSSMLSVNNNKTYVDGGNVYCATLDADAILSNDISFTGIITGGDVDGGGIIKSFNYVVDTSGMKINLYNGTIDSKNFKVSDTGVINATDAILTGTINANSGRIGVTNPFTITSTGQMYTGNKSSYNSSLNGIYIGYDGIGCGGGGYNSTYYQFKVDRYGQMTCSYAGINNANISNASITYADITYGELGAFDIDTKGLYSASNNSNKSALNDGKEGCYFSPEGIEFQGSEYLFRVNNDGSIYADKGTIASWGIDGDKIFGGTGASGSEVAVMQKPSSNTTYVFACGGSSHYNYSDCPFRVTKTGNVYSNRFILSNSYSETSGLYSYWNDGLQHPIIQVAGGGAITFGYSDEGSVSRNTIIRGETIYFACGGSSGNTTGKRIIEFDYDSYDNAGFRPTANNTTLLGSSNFKWKEIHGVTIYENGSSLSSLYASSSHTHSGYASSSHTHSNYLRTDGSTTLTSVVNMGTDTASDGLRYYINGKATGRFNLLRWKDGQALSSKRYKNTIDYKNCEYWHDKIMKIKPCTFYYNDDDSKKRIGLIAEDLFELIPELVGLDDEGKPEAIEYSNLTIPLIGEVQRLNEIVDTQNEKMTSLEDEIRQLKELVTKLVS
jgi:hypothetical protein